MTMATDWTISELGEDMSVTLTRQQLYDRVWTEPVEKLAKEYGLSDVGLGKACRRPMLR